MLAVGKGFLARAPPLSPYRTASSSLFRAARALTLLQKQHNNPFLRSSTYTTITLLHQSGHLSNRSPFATTFSTRMSSLSSQATDSLSASGTTADVFAGAVITLDKLPFDNAAIRELPVDVEPRNYVRIVPDACFSSVAPDPVTNPVLVAASTSALGLLGLGPEEGGRDDAAEYFSGEFYAPVPVMLLA